MPSRVDTNSLCGDGEDSQSRVAVLMCDQL